MAAAAVAAAPVAAAAFSLPHSTQQTVLHYEHKYMYCTHIAYEYARITGFANAQFGTGLNYSQRRPH